MLRGVKWGRAVEIGVSSVCESSPDSVASGKAVRPLIRSGSESQVGKAERRGDLQDVVGTEAGEMTDRRNDDFERTTEQM